MKKRKVFLGIMLWLTVTLGSIHSAYAEEVPFLINPILPSNQRDHSLSYYDLRVKPGTKQVIEVEVTNNQETSQLLTCEVVNATTSPTGEINYSANQERLDESNHDSVAEIASVPKDITVPAKTTTKVDVTLTLPDKSFKGVKLGALQIQLINPETKKDDTESNFTIENTYQYVIAMMLSEEDALPDPLLKLKKIYPSQQNRRNTLMVNLQNPKPLLMNQLTYQVKIYKKDRQEMIIDKEYQDYRFAPNSHFDLPISWENKPFKAGTYFLKLSAYSEELEQKWQFEEDFVITAEEAKTLNQTARDLEKNYIPYYIAGGGLLVCTIALALWYKRRKNT